MNGQFVLAWTTVGLAMGAIVAPTAAWLAGVGQRGLYRLLIAAATASTFAMLALRFAMTPALLALSVFSAAGVLLAAIDVLAQRLPRALIWPACTAVTALLITDAVGKGAETTGLLRTGAAAITLATGHLVVALVSRGGLGAGDVRAAFLVGGVLGWHGWPTLVTGTVLGFLISGAVAMACTVRNQERTVIPHGPGMLAGAFAVLLL